jgi:hypothetical protein
MLTVRLKRLASRLRDSKAPSAMLRSWSPFHLGPSNTQSQDGAHVNIPVIIASFDLPPIRLYFCRGLSTLRYDTTAAVNESFETLISIMIHLSCIVCPIHCPAMPLYEEAPCKPVREITSLRQFPLEHALMQEGNFLPHSRRLRLARVPPLASAESDPKPLADLLPRCVLVCHRRQRNVPVCIKSL